jgi:hypothetical protein
VPCGEEGVGEEGEEAVALLVPETNRMRPETATSHAFTSREGSASLETGASSLMISTARLDKVVPGISHYALKISTAVKTITNGSISYARAHTSSTTLMHSNMRISSGKVLGKF